MDQRTAWKFNFAGWLLFVLSAVYFIWASLRTGDRISLLASIFFLIANLVFLVPVWINRPK